MLCVCIRARKTFKEEERENWGKEQRRERESREEKQNLTFGEDEPPAALKKSSQHAEKIFWIFRFFWSSVRETVT